MKYLLTRTFLRHNEKVDRYQELVFEVKLIHQASSLIPIVVGALGTISKDARTWQEKLGIPDIIGSPQLSAKLGTAHVLRRVLAETCHKRTQETSLTGGKCEIPITIDMANCCCFETNQQFQ